MSKLGTQEDYNSKEAYLESLFLVAKSNFYTYLTAIKECCGKTFDLTGFLNMDASNAVHAGLFAIHRPTFFESGKWTDPCTAAGRQRPRAKHVHICSEQQAGARSQSTGVARIMIGNDNT